MKLALISTQEDKDRAPPLGLIYLATYLDKYLKEKIEIKIFDSNFDEDIPKKILEFKPDMIGISSMTVCYKRAIDFATKIKSNLNVPIMIGGVHISTLPESMEKVFDVGIIGEGEETLKELVELFLKGKFSLENLKKIKGIEFYNNDELIKTPERMPLKLDDIPIPDLDYADERYFLPRENLSAGKMCVFGIMITSRGCPYRCTFCSTSRFWKTIRFNSASYVAKNVKYQIEKYRVNHIDVLDDLFTVSKERLRELTEELKKEGVLGKVSFSCQPRANLIDEEMCILMKTLNVKSVNFGFESGSERVLNILKVGTVTTEMNKNAIILCKKYGFKVYGSLIFGSPGETISDMKETLSFMDWCKKHKADYIWTFVATPFPATIWWDEALKRGKVSNHMDWDKLSHHAVEDAMLIDVDKDEFKEIFKISREKSRGFKYGLIFSFVKEHPLFSVSLLFKNPVFYAEKFIIKVFKH